MENLPIKLFTSENSDIANWQNLSNDVLTLASSQGATAAEVDLSVEAGFSVSVRLGEVETIEFNRDNSASITVYFGQRKGSASTSDTSYAALQATVSAACDIARMTGDDADAGLADPKLLAHQYPDLDLYHPWEITPEQGIEIARECEATGLAFDSRIRNSDGASLNTHQGFYLYANSLDFCGYFKTTRHSLSASLIAQTAELMQRDYSYAAARVAADLTVPAQLAKEAAERTIRRLGARKIKTCQVPVIFDARIAGSLLGSFIGAISGGNIYRKSSFLLDKLGQKVFAPHINIYQRPHLLRALGSAPFDNEGVATTDRDYIKDGILQSYVLGSYSARKLGLASTGNSGGVHNLFINTSHADLAQLLKQMDTGLLITEVMGQGVNIVTGDYSRGATGFWVENGVIQYPVEEITIANNLSEMYSNLVAVGNDIYRQGNIATGSILIERMMVGGS